MGTTNNLLQIASTTSPFRETNLGTDDINLTPADVPVPHCNYAPLPEAIGKTSNRTLIEGGNVIRKDDKVCQKSHDDHAGTKGGKKSKTYLKQAWCTKGSPNVRCEGVEPARFLDPTVQNNENSKGLVIDPAMTAMIKKMREERDKRCSVDKLEIAECRHKRQITEARILEIVVSNNEPDHMDFFLRRKNAVEADKDPECHWGDDHHTEWVITRKEGGGLEAKTDTQHGDKLKLENDWFCDEDEAFEHEAGEENEEGDKAAEKEIEDAAKAKAARERAKTIHDRSKAIRAADPNFKGSVVEAKAWYDERGGKQDTEKRNAEKYQNTRNKIKKAQELVDKAFELKDFLECWFARKDPVRVTVVGQACTGSQSVEILAFPEERVEFSLGEKELKLVKSATDAINKFADFLTGLCAPLGNAKIKLVVLEKVETKLGIQWHELEKDAPNAGLKKYQCNTDISIIFNIEKIFGLEIELALPLARLLDFFIPGAGWAVQKVCNWFGLGAEAFVGIKASIGVEFSLVLDEYWEKIVPKVAIVAEFKVEIGARIYYRDNFKVEGKAVAVWKPRFENPAWDKEAVFSFELASGSVDIGFEGEIYISFFVFEYNRTGSYFPPSWKMRYGKQVLRPLKPVMALIKN